MLLTHFPFFRMLPGCLISILFVTIHTQINKKTLCWCVLQNSLLFPFFFQSQVVEFAWTSIKEWEVDDEAMAFCFQYQRPEKNPRWVKIFTPYVSLFS